MEKVVSFVGFAEVFAFFVKVGFEPLLHPRTSAEKEVVGILHGALKHRVLSVADSGRKVSLRIILAAGIECKYHIVSVFALLVNARNTAKPHHCPSFGTLLEFFAVVTFAQVRNRNPHSLETLYGFAGTDGDNFVFGDCADKVLRNASLVDLPRFRIGGHLADFVGEFDVLLKFFVVVGKHKGYLLVAFDVFFEFFKIVGIYFHCGRFLAEVYLNRMKLYAGVGY